MFDRILTDMSAALATFIDSRIEAALAKLPKPEVSERDILDALETFDFTSQIETALEAIDFDLSSQIEEAVEGIDLDSAVEDALCNQDMSDHIDIYSLASEVAPYVDKPDLAEEAETTAKLKAFILKTVREALA